MLSFGDPFVSVAFVLVQLVLMLIDYLKFGVLQSFMLCYWFVDVYDIG